MYYYHGRGTLFSIGHALLRHCRFGARNHASTSETNRNAIRRRPKRIEEQVVSSGNAFTVFITLAVVLAWISSLYPGKTWEDTHNDDINLPFTMYYYALFYISILHFVFTHRIPQICQTEDDSPQQQPNTPWRGAEYTLESELILPNATAQRLLFENPSPGRHVPDPRAPDAVDELYGLQSLDPDNLVPIWDRIQASMQKVSTR